MHHDTHHNKGAQLAQRATGMSLVATLNPTRHSTYSTVVRTVGQTCNAPRQRTTRGSTGNSARVEVPSESGPNPHPTRRFNSIVQVQVHMLCCASTECTTKHQPINCHSVSFWLGSMVATSYMTAHYRTTYTGLD